MKKKDIIAQKLFETCKLSEFYLNLLKSEDESPMQLAHAYKQKLYEIVERYDRLLDNANTKQREQLSLDLEYNHSNINSKTMTKPKSLSLSKTSTPNKSMSALNTPINGQTPISVLTSSSSTNCMPHQTSNPPSYASTPATTPGLSSIKSFNRGSTRSIYSQANQQHRYSNKQMQKFAYLYADSTDESEPEEDDYFNYKTGSSNNVKCQLEYDSYSTSGHSKKSVLTNSESDTEEEEQEKGLSNRNNGALLNVYNSKNIEKSYSNLSKDSGVFGESYHSECSNHHITGIGSKQNESCEERISDEEQNTFDENLTSPASSASSSNNYESNNNNNFHSAESTPKPKRPTDLGEPASFIWGTVSRMVEEPEELPEQSPVTVTTESTDTFSSLPTRPVKPLKSKFLMNKLNNLEYTQQPKNLLKSSLNNSLLKQSNNFRTFTKNLSSNVDVDNTDMTSIMTGNESGSYSTQSSVETANSSMQQIDEESCSSSNDEKSPKSSFIFNYGSNMMNVSMLDNIQATNTSSNPEVDMNCSILMFN